MENANGRYTADDLVKACEHYFSMRCRQLTCFDELRAPVGLLDAPFQQRLVEFSQDEARKLSQLPTASPMVLLNALKLEYCFLVSPATSATITRDFVCKIVCRYREFCSANRQSDESVAQLAMLACTATLRATHVEQENKGNPNLQYVSYLQAAFLLRYCLTRMKDDYPTLVVLTRLLTLLGAVSFSAIIFKKLSIKNLQWENAGHLLLTRLSTLHPQGSNGDEGTFDPLQTLDVAMAANANSIRSVRRHIMAGLNHKSYVNVVETIGLREDLRKSFSKQLYEVEATRAKRLRDLPDSEREPFSSGKWHIPHLIFEDMAQSNATIGPFVDRRDFGFIPSFEHPYVKPFAHYLEAGPNPKVRPESYLLLDFSDSRVGCMASRHEDLRGNCRYDAHRIS
jgi:N-terminal acetyltransferase B complex non-catalytic subunit